MTYTCVGDVRGSCEIKHRTLEACQDHCDADMRACRSLPGGTAYSDRSPEASDGSDVMVCGRSCDHEECY